MSGADLSKICNLANQLLKPYTETVRSPLSKEKEKEILISITEASKQIRGLKKLGSSEDVASARVVCSFKQCKETLTRKNHNCLAEIVSTLTRYLSSSNLYVQQSAANILVTLSEFLLESGSDWEGLIHLLLVALDAELLNISSSPVLSNYLTLTGLFRVLCNTLKYLKQGDGEIEEKYNLSFGNSLSNVSWELLHRVFDFETDGILDGCSQSDSFSQKIGFQEAKDVLLVTLLQLFCSLVSDSGMKDITGDSFDEHPIVIKIRQLVPQLFSWCFCSGGKHISGRISLYFRHKILVLMIRLSFSSQLQCSTLVLWLQLLKAYCGDLLQEPLSQNGVHLEDGLENSPFSASITVGDQMCNLSSRHLQRQAIFLFFKCSFGLICQSTQAGGGWACRTDSAAPVQGMETGSSSCYSMGLSELSCWLERHTPSLKYMGDDIYLTECQKFAASFVHLFMDEDDLLFAMLLQLLSSPLPVKLHKHGEGFINFNAIKGDAAYLISSIFNPIHLFHLLLAELHYDHSVLLDYLISKDIGILCVRYLLRCLRLVSELWDTFVEFSNCEYGKDQLSGKKRKFCLLPKWGPHGELEPSSTSEKGIQSPMRMQTDLTHEAFQNAKQCLLSLNQSVKNLHMKNLFPYNPAALLRRCLCSRFITARITDALQRFGVRDMDELFSATSTKFSTLPSSQITFNRTETLHILGEVESSQAKLQGSKKVDVMTQSC